MKRPPTRELAEEDWTRGTPASAHQSFSAGPSFTVRPTGSGASDFARNITRVNERHEVRSRIYRAAVDLMRSTPTPDTAVQPPPPLKAAGEPAWVGPAAW